MKWILCRWCWIPRGRWFEGAARKLGTVRLFRRGLYASPYTEIWASADCMAQSDPLERAEKRCTHFLVKQCAACFQAAVVAAYQYVNTQNDGCSVGLTARVSPISKRDVCQSQSGEQGATTSGTKSGPIDSPPRQAADKLMHPPAPLDCAAWTIQ